MTKKLISLCLIKGMGISMVVAQSINSESIHLQQAAEIEKKFPVKEFSTQAISLPQQNTSGNHINIVQRGTSNTVLLQQIGVSNASEIQQIGEGHIYSGSIIGNNNSNIVLQEGAGNTLVQELRTDNRIYKISQQGFNNELKQYENGTTPSIPMEISQRGTGMQVIITNGNLFN